MTTYEPARGSIVHVDLYSDDPAATRAFCETAFGWAFETVEGTDYATWRAPNAPGGGIVSLEPPFDSPGAVFYVDVADLAATAGAITDADGEILLDETEVDGMGVFLLFRDPGGVVGAAWEDRSEGESSDEEWARFK